MLQRGLNFLQPADDLAAATAGVDAL